MVCNVCPCVKHMETVSRLIAMDGHLIIVGHNSKVLWGLVLNVFLQSVFGVPKYVHIKLQ